MRREEGKRLEGRKKGGKSRERGGERAREARRGLQSPRHEGGRPEREKPKERGDERRERKEGWSDSGTQGQRNEESLLARTPAQPRENKGIFLKEYAAQPECQLWESSSPQVAGTLQGTHTPESISRTES